MVVIEKDTEQRLFESVFRVLTGDSELGTLLGGSSPENPKVYQTFIDLDTATALKFSTWITFNTSNDVPHDVEQTQDIANTVLELHVFRRGPGSDAAELVGKRIRELLDHGETSLASDELLCWFCLYAGRRKAYEIQAELWHIIIQFRTMIMAKAAD